MRRLFPCLVALCVLAPATASADSNGKTGVITRMRLNSPSSSQHASQQGYIKIKSGKKDAVVYKFGGSGCSGPNLDDNLLDLIRTAFVQGLKVTPIYKAGNGGQGKCLVAVEVRRGGSGGGNKPPS